MSNMRHVADITITDKLWDRLKGKFVAGKKTECWSWLGTINQKGYACIVTGGGTKAAHRLIYRRLRGEIGRQAVLDHLCRNRACVNPSHLEPVSDRENNSRSTSPSAKNKVKTHCNNGHEYTKENTYVYPYGGRDCRMCRTERVRKFIINRRKK